MMSETRRVGPVVIDLAHAQQGLEGTGDLPPLQVGDHVIDADTLTTQEPEVFAVKPGAPIEAEGVATLVVVAQVPKRASDHYYKGPGGPTVATSNPGYPEADRVFEVVYPQPHHHDISHPDVERYAFPRARLVRVSPVHGDDRIIFPAQGDLDALGVSLPTPSGGGDDV